ncbi:MAG: hypothetical protein IBJ00_04220 [Alphaproteobacteria bacterium]|nr:hypothetical protein [Alphaproteobacteria bacterium]
MLNQLSSNLYRRYLPSILGTFLFSFLTCMLHSKAQASPVTLQQIGQMQQANAPIEAQRLCFALMEAGHQRHANVALNSYNNFVPLGQQINLQQMRRLRVILRQLGLNDVTFPHLYNGIMNGLNYNQIYPHGNNIVTLARFNDLVNVIDFLVGGPGNRIVMMQSCQHYYR